MTITYKKGFVENHANVNIVVKSQKKNFTIIMNLNQYNRKSKKYLKKKYSVNFFQILIIKINQAKNKSHQIF